MERRAFLAGILSTVATPWAARGQQPGKPARLGIFYGSKPDFTPDSDLVDRAFVDGLAAHGYVVGRDVVIESAAPRGGPSGTRPSRLSWSGPESTSFSQGTR